MGSNVSKSNMKTSVSCTEIVKLDIEELNDNKAMSRTLSNDRIENTNKNNIKSKSLSNQKVKVRALYDFIPNSNKDLKFKKGDILLVTFVSKNSWLYAEHLQTHEFGFIPRNYVVIDDDSPESLDAFFKISRLESEKKLVLPGYEEGTYLIRPINRHGGYALSIRAFDKTKQYYIVVHYKICNLPTGNFYIMPQKEFKNMKSLLSFYSGQTGDLCCRLKDPFPKLYSPSIQFRDIEVSRKCIRLEKIIGRGNFGHVWYAKWNGTITVAVKTLKRCSDNQSQRKALIEEASLMHKLHHRRIVEILGICSFPEEEPVYLITEYMAKGTLRDILHKDHKRNLDFLDMRYIILQIADGMSYLESENFVHRDLRAANILVAEDMSVKVADFGLALLIDGTNEKKGSKFPVRWTAPEAGLRRMFTTKSDVWSFGVLIYEIITYGQLPYSEIEFKDILTVVDRGYRLKKPTGHNVVCPSELYSIMKLCWQAIPENRPTFAFLKSVFSDFQVFDERIFENNDIP